MPMPSSQLKRAERSIQTIRDQGELPPETADALQELVDVIRTIEVRVSALEGQRVGALDVRPVQPGRRIYPPPCKECDGKGRIPKVVNLPA
jgi:hypothetical protein